MWSDEYFTVVQYVFIPDVCHILWVSSVLCSRSFRLAKQKTRAQFDLGQNWEPLLPWAQDPPPPKFPELSEEALLIRKWYLWIYVDLSRNVNETSNLKFLSDWRPVGGLWRALELTGQATLSLGWCGDHHLIWALAGQHPFRPLSCRLGSSFKVTYLRFPLVL